MAESTNKKAPVVFYRGDSASFDAEKHLNGIYFATDVNELYMSYRGVDDEIVTRVYGSEYLIKDINLVDNNTIKIDYRDGTLESKTINLIDLLQKATAEVAGLMSSEDKAHHDTLWGLYESDSFGKVDGIDVNDKILSFDENSKLISADVSIDYDSENKELRLLGKKHSIEGEMVPYVLGTVDATPFIKDGMLNDVEVVTEEDGKKYIKFIWNINEEGKDTTKTDKIALEDLFTILNGGDGISIDENYNINVDLAPGTGSLDTISTKNDQGENVLVNVSRSKNFLEFDNDDKLRVSAITTDASILQKDITVAGLNGTFGTGNYKNNDVIKAGTSIYDILVKILSQEIYPAVGGSSGARVSNVGNLTSKFSNPSFTLGNSGKTVEVGTTVAVSGVTGYDPTATPTSRQYAGFTNGHSLKYNINGSSEKPEADSNYAADYSTSIEVLSGNPSNVPFPESGEGSVTLNYGTYTLTRTYSGTGAFGKSGNDLKTVSTVTTKAPVDGELTPASSACIISGVNNLVVAEGTNKVTYKIEGPGHSGTIPASQKYYVVSNLGNAKSTLSVAAQNAKSFDISAATAGSSELTVTGAYYNIYQVSATADVTLVTNSGDAVDTSVGAGKKYKSFTTVASIEIKKDTVAKIVILSKSKTVTSAKWISAGFTQDWLAQGKVTNETGAVDFTLPDGSTVKYNKITIVADAVGGMFGTDGTFELGY